MVKFGLRSILAGALFVMSVVTAQAQTFSVPSFLHPLADTAPSVSYGGYTPSACVAAVRRVGTQVRRDAAARPTAWSQAFLENDTVLTVERRIATTCTATANIATAAPYELPDLARLYWFAGDTARMRQAIDRRLALDTTDVARATTYLHLLTRFLLSSERDVALVAHRVVPALDSLTSLNARVVRVQAHAALAHAFASSRRRSAADSTQAEIAAAMASFATMPALVQTVMIDTVGPLFELGATEATERGDTVIAQALLDYARQSLSPLPDGARYVHRTEDVVRYFGMTAPPIHADFAYGAPPGTSAAGPWPRPGHWTLVCPMPYDRSLAGFYQHIHQLFGDTVDIVFYTATRGSWRPRGPLMPSEEGTLTYDYLSRRWGFPGVLLVETRPFHQLPDGRRMDDPTITPALYAHTGLVIDPHGTIRAMLQPSTLARFDQLLSALLHPAVTTGGPAPTPLSAR